MIITSEVWFAVTGLKSSGLRINRGNLGVVKDFNKIQFYKRFVDQEWSNALQNPNPKCLMKGWCCCCVWEGSGYNRMWSTPLLNLKLMWFKTFLKSSVFPTKWKTTCCFVDSTGCFTLRSFEKVENYFSLVDLTVKSNNRLFRGFNWLFLWKS